MQQADDAVRPPGWHAAGRGFLAVAQQFPVQCPLGTGDCGRIGHSRVGPEHASPVQVVCRRGQVATVRRQVGPEHRYARQAGGQAQ